MINREITYERSVSRSYMKIPACVEATFDEEIMLKKEISGLLQVEKCYLNGSGQYWYNITGKQALDSFIKMKTIGITFVEKLLLNICSQIEKLEWNLLGTNCLVLEPELIFISNGSEEIYFTLYPDNKGEVYTEITKLVEYLLTKLDHKDAEAVKTAYGIYELTLTEGYSIADIRTAIEKRKTESVVEEKREDIRISVDDGAYWFTLDEMETVVEHKWEYGVPMIVRVFKDGGLSAGDHEVDLNVIVRTAYIPIPLDGHKTRTVTIA